MENPPQAMTRYRYEVFGFNPSVTTRPWLEGTGTHGVARVGSPGAEYSTRAESMPLTAKVTTAESALAALVLAMTCEMSSSSGAMWRTFRTSLQGPAPPMRSLQ